MVFGPTSGNYQQPAFRPMSMGDILDRTFKVFARAWKPLCLTSLIGAVPSGIAMAFVTVIQASAGQGTNGFLYQLITASQQRKVEALVTFGIGYLGLIVLGLMIYPLIRGSLIAISSYAFMGQTLSFGDAMRISRSRYWRMFGTLLLIGLFAILATIGAVLAGLLIFAFITVPIAYCALFTYLVFTDHAVIIEGTGGGWTALRRSMTLVTRRFWPLLGLGIVFIIMLSVINYMVQLPMLFGTLAIGDNPLWLIMVALVAMVPPMLLISLSAVGQTVAYYDTRMRKEGLDLVWMTTSGANDQPMQ